LARAGLAGDRVQPGHELELGVADQDQILDAQTAQHRVDGTRAVGARLPSLRDEGRQAFNAHEANVSRYLLKKVRSGSVASRDRCSPRRTSTRCPGSSLPTSIPSTITVTDPSRVRFVTASGRS